MILDTVAPEGLAAELDRAVEEFRTKDGKLLDLDHLLVLAKTIGWDDGFQRGRAREREESANTSREVSRARRDEQRLRTVLHDLNRAHVRTLGRLAAARGRLEAVRGLVQNVSVFGGELREMFALDRPSRRPPPAPSSESQTP